MTQIALLTPAEITAIVKDAYQAGQASQIGETWNAKQVAEYLGVSVGTVYNSAAAGEIPHRRIGKKPIFNSNTVAEWVAGGKK